jgi:formate hydrogenlyase subunit 6/NADH:ubiquinone oxidoreductase subunit I
MKQIFLSLVLLAYVQAADENFSRDANGVTIHCEKAAVDENGNTKCIACNLCAINCPAGCITVESEKKSLFTRWAERLF